MINSKYSASFTAAALLYQEHIRLKDVLLSADFAQLVDREVEQNRFLSIKTRSARKRTVLEIKKRFSTAGLGFWPFFFQRRAEEQRLALLFLCLKAYPLMMDFHIEVALKKWREMSPHLDRMDMQMRMDEIASAHPEVDAWSESTKTKTMTVYIRAITEAGLLKKGALQQPRNIEPDFWDYFARNGEMWFREACFSMSR